MTHHIPRALIVALLTITAGAGCAHTSVERRIDDAVYAALVNGGVFDEETGTTASDSTVERDLREQLAAAGARATEAEDIAREAVTRLDRADRLVEESEVITAAYPSRPYGAGASAYRGSPTQVIPTSGAVMYIDRLPPGLTARDTLQVRCNGSGSCRTWLLVILGNELPSEPMDGQHPHAQRVDLGGIDAEFHLLPPGATGYIVPDNSGYEVIRIAVFEGNPLMAAGLRYTGVATYRGDAARRPTGRFLTDAGRSHLGGDHEAVRALLARIRGL